MWAGTGERAVRHKVAFENGFQEKPVVQLSITLMDADSNQHLRYSLNVEKITKNEFEVVFKTWSDSRFARVWVSWTAYGQVPDPDMWDVQKQHFFRLKK